MRLSSRIPVWCLQKDSFCDAGRQSVVEDEGRATAMDRDKKAHEVDLWGRYDMAQEGPARGPMPKRCHGKCMMKGLFEQTFNSIVTALNP